MAAGPETETNEDRPSPVYCKLPEYEPCLESLFKVKYMGEIYTVESVIEHCEIQPIKLYKLKERPAFKNVPADKCQSVSGLEESVPHLLTIKP